MFENNKFKISNKEFCISTGGNGKKIEFQYPIRKVIEYQDVYFIRIEPDIGKILNENVFCYDKEGNFVWQVEPIPLVKKDSPYTNIYMQGSKLFLYNWGGVEVEVEPMSGKILSKCFTK